MIGAIVRQEWLLRARRDGFRPLLSCYFACLLLDGCAWYYPAITSIFLPPSPARNGQFLMGALEFLWFQQWLLPLLLAPPFLAGAFTREKANRILPLLFTTPCTSAEMILGKFLARVFPLLLLGLAQWPFWGLLAGLVGIDPLSASVLAVASLLPILGMSAVGQLTSVCCTKHSDAVVASYAVLAAGSLCVWQLDAAASSSGPACMVMLENGVAPFGPGYLEQLLGDDGGGIMELCRRTLITTAAWGTVVIGCLGLACWRLRAAVTERPQLPRSRLSSNRPAVGDEPIRWKEYYRERRLPLALFRYIPTWLGLLAVFAGTGYVSLWMLCPSGTTFAELMESLRADGLQAVDLIRTFQPNRPALVFVQGLGVLFLAALMVGVRAATAISGERESRTWEALLLTPLSTRELVHGKVRGIVQSALPYLAAYALAAIPLAWLAGPRELQVLLLTLLPAWPIMSVAGAVGINQSARAADSWRSILATVRLITVGGFLTAVVSNFVIGFLALVMMGLGDLIEKLVGCLPFLDWLGMERRYQRGLYFFLALGSFGVLICVQASRECLAKAVKWVDDNERTQPSSQDTPGVE